MSIAQIEGRARGAGSEFALACDMRFAARETAVFSQMEGAFGLIPGGGAAQSLTRLMGRGHAMEVMLGALDYDADTAERYGCGSTARCQLRHSTDFVAALARRIARFPAAGHVAIKARHQRHRTGLRRRFSPRLRPLRGNRAVRASAAANERRHGARLPDARGGTGSRPPAGRTRRMTTWSALMFEKQDVSFPVEGGVDLSAWLFVPEHRTAPLPAITMAHGFAGTKYHDIEPFAEAFGRGRLCRAAARSPRLRRQWRHAAAGHQSLATDCRLAPAQFPISRPGRKWMKIVSASGARAFLAGMPSCSARRTGD